MCRPLVNGYTNKKYTGYTKRKKKEKKETKKKRERKFKSN